ncbi:hypothetical protein L3X38_031038 [Prunus dulcis]|uniref:Uncharacterized protein n=1 Tax=Prunus dulcis TaxID=3755 RepID=A0AAD4YUM8_PRUDU|nr:hypothetical protein L3X38_031038 [Prunus dulcis]
MWDHSKAQCKNRDKTLNTSSDLAPVSPAVPTAPAPASTSVATTGAQGYVLHSFSKKNIWVIDTGATDHMTLDHGQITSHTSSSESVVSNANEGTEPYQILKRKNRGKPLVHYEAYLNAKGKYLINNYVSISRLSEVTVHFVKQLTDIPIPNSATEALEDSKWKKAMIEEIEEWHMGTRALPHGKKTMGYS